MRQAVFASTLITLFSFIGQMQPRTPPLVQIIEEEDIKDNSFNKKNLSFRFITDNNCNCAITVNEKSVMDNDVQEITNTQTTLQKTYKVQLKDYLDDGSNTIELIVEKERMKTTKTMNLEISSAHKTIEGINFQLCKRAFLDYQKSPEQYITIAKEMNRINDFMPVGAKTLTMIIQYEPPCEQIDEIPAGGSQNAWAFQDNALIFGYGIISQFNGTTEPRDTITHEYGHKLYKTLPDSKLKRIDGCYRAINSLENAEVIFNMFKEGNYTVDKNSGHPAENSRELFASAFLIQMQYQSQFNDCTLFLKEDEQELAHIVMDIVTEALNQ